MPSRLLGIDGLFTYRPIPYVTPETPSVAVDDVVESATLADTPAKLQALLQAYHIEVDYGCELLDWDESTVTDISENVLGGSVSRNCFDTIHGTCQLTIDRELDWDTAKVRPYMTIEGGGYTQTRYLGTYHLDTPSTPLSTKVWE